VDPIARRQPHVGAVIHVHEKAPRLATRADVTARDPRARRASRKRMAHRQQRTAAEIGPCAVTPTVILEGCQPGKYSDSEPAPTRLTISRAEQGPQATPASGETETGSRRGSVLLCPLGLEEFVHPVQRMADRLLRRRWQPAAPPEWRRPDASDVGLDTTRASGPPRQSRLRSVSTGSRQIAVGRLERWVRSRMRSRSPSATRLRRCRRPTEPRPRSGSHQRPSMGDDKTPRPPLTVESRRSEITRLGRARFNPPSAPLPARPGESDRASAVADPREPHAQAISYRTGSSPCCRK